MRIASLAMIAAVLAAGAVASTTVCAQTVDDAVSRGNQECIDLAAAHELTSAVEVAACMNQHFLQALQTYQWQHMEAANDFATARLGFARELDDGVISADQMSTRIQGAYNDMLARVRLESAAKARAQNQALAAAQAQLDAMTALAEAQQGANMLRFGSGLDQPTRTGTFAESLGSGFGAAAGIPTSNAQRGTLCTPNGTGGFYCQPQ